MSGESAYRLNLIIDSLTNSIRRVDNSKDCETEISLAASEDIKPITKKAAGIFHGKVNLRKPTGRYIN